MSSMTRDMITIRRMGIEALTERLGSVGMVEFLRQFDSGYGDYTMERQQWLDNVEIDEIVLIAKKRRGKQTRAKPSQGGRVL